MSEWRQIAQIIGVHGIRGVLKARQISDFPQRLTVPGQRWLQTGGDPRPVTLLKGTEQINKNLFLLSFQECQDRNTAETWVGAVVVVPETDHPPLGTEEYYVPDLVGLQVMQQGKSMGVIVAVLAGAAQDLLEIQVGEERKLLPFVKALVPEVDLNQGWVIIDPPAGW